MFAEDLDVFLADFGVPCQAGATAFVALLDQPDEVMDVGRAAGVSRQYQLTYRTDAVTLTRNQAVTVNGVAHTVREAPKQLDDGAFSQVLTSKV